MMQNLPFEPEFEQAYKGMSLLILYGIEIRKGKIKRDIPL
jgi:hypothetical protein